MLTRKIALATVIALTATSAFASGDRKSARSPDGSDCTVSYALFENAVPHVDLEACPASMGLGDEDVFCRASVANDMVTVYAFDSKGFQCLEGLKSYDSREFKITLP